MEAKQVYSILNAVNERQAPTLGEQARDYLRERGLVFVKSPAEHAALESDVKRYETVDDAYFDVSRRVTDIRGQYFDLDARLNSFWHWLVSSKKTLEHERAQLTGYAAQKETLERELEKASAERKQVDEAALHLKEYKYVQTPIGYVALTPSGKARLGQLHHNLEKLKDIDYDAFCKQLGEISARQRTEAARTATTRRNSDDDWGFSIPGAIVGDLLDDLSLNLSGGAIIGGVVGGLLDDGDDDF